MYNQSITDNEGNITEIRHSERNELHQEISRQQGKLISAFDYDPMGRLTKQFSSSSDHIAVERHYSYDVLGQLTHLTGRTRLGSTQSKRQTPAQHFTRGHGYQYDSIGRLTQHKLSDYDLHSGITEVFAFDPASNRVPVSSADKDTAGQDSTHPSGRPKQLLTTDKVINYTYDSQGRVLFKTTEPRQGNSALKQSSKHLVSYKESLQLYYNPNDELAQSIKITQQGGKLTVITTDYQYDAFGRRIHKHNRIQHKSRIHPSGKVFKDPIQTSKTQHEHVSYLWDGNRQLQEQTATHVFTTVYEQDSFEPVARLVWLKDELLQAANDEIRNTPREVWEDEPKLIPSMQVYHYHNDHLGTPNELTNQDGEVIWLADYEAWGNTAKIVYRPIELKGIQVSADELQPLRFQGQFVDTETGLHYNRFRYYDPDLGMFVSRDPIGLMGGSNVFQYTPNPTGWIDPFGLVTLKEQQARALAQANILRNAELAKTSGQATVVNVIVTKDANNLAGAAAADVAALLLELDKYADSKCVKAYKRAAKKILLKTNKDYDDFLNKFISTSKK